MSTPPDDEVLPDEMDDMNGDISHTLSITSMQQPAEGFFPTRVGAEVNGAQWRVLELLDFVDQGVLD